MFAFDQANRREDMQALFDSFDLDCSGCIDINELGVVVSTSCSVHTITVDSLFENYGRSLFKISIIKLLHFTMEIQTYISFS